MKVELTPELLGRRLDCGHTPGELFMFQSPQICTDHETGESICGRCSDDRHYDRVRKQFAQIDAKAAAEGWEYEYLSEGQAYTSDLTGKLVCRAYWRHDPLGIDAARGILQPAHMYNFAFKRLKNVVIGTTTGYALLFEDGTRDSLCYDTVCVATREPAGLQK
jgi:hypothetical protein